MVKVHINNTKHITMEYMYIPPRDSTSTHYKAADTDIQHCIQYTTNIPHSVLTRDVNAHSALCRSLAQLRTNKLPFLKSYLHKVAQNQIHHLYAPFITLTYTTHIISSTLPRYVPHHHPWICGLIPPELLHCWPDKQNCINLFINICFILLLITIKHLIL